MKGRTNPPYHPQDTHNRKRATNLGSAASFASAPAETPQTPASSSVRIRKASPCSHTRNDARRQRLEEHFDLTADELARLRGPVGVYIGSKTPPEIALSILAEVVAAKNGVAVPHDMLVAPAKDLREAA